MRERGIVGSSSNYTLYGDMSNRMVSILHTYSPHVEVYTIDESFLGLGGMDGLWPSRTVMRHDIRARVQQWRPVKANAELSPSGGV